MSLLSKVTRHSPALPSRVVMYASEKFGKTSFATFAPAPIFLMTAGETGLLSLLEAGRVKPTDHFPDDFKTWAELLVAVHAILTDDHPFTTLVIDTANGAENLCAAHVCRRHFNDDWQEYASYGKGDTSTQKEWASFLRLLDEVRTQRLMSILFLHHAKVKTFSNPSGKDWDQWKPECIEKCWALTHKWADIILFGGFKVTVVKDKATSESRYLRCNASGSIVAGNRYGLPDEITAPAGAENLWKAFANALGKAKAVGRAIAEAAAKAPQLPTDEPPVAALENSPAPQPEAPRAIADKPQEPQQPAPQPAKGNLPQVTQRILLDAFHQLDLAWNDAKCKVRASEILGRTVGEGDHISTLSTDEADKLIRILVAKIDEKKAKAAARAAKKETAGATA